MMNGPSHEDLLTLARKVNAAAQDRDPDRIRVAGLKLFEALVDHLAHEAAVLVRLPSAEANSLRRGQWRLVDTVADLAGSAALPDGQHTQARAEELIALLELQARDERLHLSSRDVHC
jgi:hypothetical protein